MAKVFIGVGHGGKDSGAVGNGLKEKDLNLAIAKACADVLKDHGVTVGMSRKKDENDDLNEEIRECNAFAPDLAIDIHNNAGGGDGVEAFYHHGGGKGKTLAENVLSEIVSIGQNSRGAKTRKNSRGTDYYGFIRETKCPAVIVECAFIDNAKDIKIIDTAAEQKKMGVAVAKGILKTLDIKYQATKKKEPSNASKTPTTSKSYLVRVTASSLNIRKGAGTNYAVVGLITDKGTYTIIEESKGKGSDKGWGKLKSGAGWISLDYCKKV
jgi:N-acetylmuramoyl-L-alanine amidase